MTLPFRNFFTNGKVSSYLISVISQMSVIGFYMFSELQNPNPQGDDRYQRDDRQAYG